MLKTSGHTQGSHNPVISISQGDKSASPPRGLTQRPSSQIPATRTRRRKVMALISLQGCVQCALGTASPIKCRGRWMECEVKPNRPPRGQCSERGCRSHECPEELGSLVRTLRITRDKAQWTQINGPIVFLAISGVQDTRPNAKGDRDETKRK